MAVSSIGVPWRHTSRVSTFMTRSAKAELLPAAVVEAAAPQHGAQPGHQLVEAERLGHVVVAEREPRDLVLGGVAGGEEDDRHLVPHLAQPAADVDPLHVGEHDVEQDQVGPVASAALARASDPVAATSTVNPSKRRAVQSRSVMYGSSSTTRMRALSAPGETADGAAFVPGAIRP